MNPLTLNLSAVPAESIIWLEMLVWCNEVLGQCLLGHPIGTPGHAAEEYEKTSAMLARPDGTDPDSPLTTLPWHLPPWPEDALAKARASRHADVFPWLVPLFEQREPGSRCPVWEEFTARLFASQTYRNFINEEMRSYLPHRQFRPDDAQLSARDRAVREFEYLLQEMTRHVIGRATMVRELLCAGKIPEGHWLQAALYGARQAVGQGWREVELGKRRRGARPVAGTHPSVEGMAILESRPTAEDGPDFIAENNERDDLIGKMIEGLPENERGVLWLRLWKGQTWEKTAANMGISVGAAKKLWKQALCNLTKKLLEEAKDEETRKCIRKALEVLRAKKKHDETKADEDAQ